MTIQVQGYRWSQFLQRLFLARGGAGGVGQVVLDDILPVVELTDPQDFENRRPRGEDLFAGFGTASPIGGQCGEVSLQNLTGSNRLVVVESVLCWASMLCTVALGGYDTVLGSTNPIGPTDRRNPGVNLTGTINVGAAAQVGPVTLVSQTVGYGVIAANANPIELLYPCGVVLPPGRGLAVAQQANAAGLVTALFRGYIRDAEPSELV